jgi:methylmalonyl-CoA mutase N-terminal domain/subunit
VNKYESADAAPVIPAPDFSALEGEQRARLARVKQSRDAAGVKRSLAALGAAAKPYGGAASASRVALMPLIIDAVRARASVGEIADTLSAEWGHYRPA